MNTTFSSCDWFSLNKFTPRDSRTWTLSFLKTMGGLLGQQLLFVPESHPIEVATLGQSAHSIRIASSSPYVACVISHQLRWDIWEFFARIEREAK